MLFFDVKEYNFIKIIVIVVYRLLDVNVDCILIFEFYLIMMKI